VSRILLACSLFAALSGPLLREAEGANDLARLAEQLGSPPLVEEIDGGVGDDQGETITRESVSGDLVFPGGLSWDVGTAIDCPLSSVLIPSRFDLAAFFPLQDRAPSLPTGSGRRHAWLQLYLF
jgi:hypothetical protein